MLRSIYKFSVLIVLLGSFLSGNLIAQNNLKKISGFVVTPQNEVVPKVKIIANTSEGKKETETDLEGRFSLEIPNEPIILSVSGKKLQSRTFSFAKEQLNEELKLEISFIIAPIHEELVITAENLEPSIERRNFSEFGCRNKCRSA
jgi:hypothetical protein